MKKKIISIIFSSLLLASNLTPIVTLIFPDSKDIVLLHEPLHRTVDLEQSRGSETRQKIIIVQATAYTYMGSKTITGTEPKNGTIAVDPNVIPLGSKIYVPGYGWGIAEDTGKSIKGYIIDVYMDSRKSAIEWGRKKEVQIQVIEP